jgi:lipid-A-disaccharide synthase
MGSSRASSRKIFMSAGEASGDLHGSRLARAIVELDPGVRVSCLGGRRLREAGADVLVDNREIAVVGLFEVFHHAKAIYAAWRRIRAHLLRERPSVVVLIDYPDFNFLLGRMAKRLGCKVFYYISPQVWAWRSGRVRGMKRFVDAMAVVLPFEKDFYARYGMDVHYVGHPLLDVMGSAPSREEARRRYCSDASGPVVGLLPGSRRGEAAVLLPVLLEAASMLHSRLPNVSFLLPVAPTLNPSAIAADAAKWDAPVQIVENDAYGVMRACDLVVSASGTATLETAILGTPMIIIYKVSALSYHVGKNLIRVKHVGMPNVILGRGAAPELLQGDATPSRVADEAAGLLNDPCRMDAQRRSWAMLAERLGTPGVAERAARLVLGLAS